MRKAHWLLAALVALVLAGCGAKPQELIIGKWEPVDAKNAVRGLEFSKDGAMRFSLARTVWVDGKYRFIGDEHVELEKSFLGITHVEKYSVTIKKDDLIATDEKGNKHEFKRVK